VLFSLCSETSLIYSPFWKQNLNPDNGFTLYYVVAGFIGGEFIKRTKIQKPGQEIYASEPPEYFGQQDFYVGNILVLFGFLFVLVDADEYTLRYMEINCQEVRLFCIGIILSSLVYLKCIEMFKFC
jgi:hypothetical protein